MVAFYSHVTRPQYSIPPLSKYKKKEKENKKIKPERA